MQRYRTHAGILDPYPEREATARCHGETGCDRRNAEKMAKEHADADHACVMRTRLRLCAMSATTSFILISFEADTSEQDLQKSRGSFGIPARL
jgi:hypothetical protein